MEINIKYLILIYVSEYHHIGASGEHIGLWEKDGKSKLKESDQEDDL